jgi:DNA mismatch repair protein MSH2
MGDVLVRLDVLASYLEVTATAPKPYVRPVLHDERAGTMMLDRLRNHCLEVLDGMSFVASKLSFRQGKTVCECL